MNLLSLLTNVLFWPVTGPMYLLRFSLTRVEDLVREELTDEGRIKAGLIELQMELELGDIDQEEYAAREAELMQEWRAVREWREHFGMAVSGGVVRVEGRVRVQSALEAGAGGAAGEVDKGADEARAGLPVESDSVASIELNLDHD